MTIRRMCNPQSFCKEANKLNIRYEFLIEARNCVGDQSLARMFNGSSMRSGGGSISAGTINNWLKTFEFIEQNPVHIDNEQYVAHRLEPKNEYYEYIKIIQLPINDNIINSWKTLSNKKLGDEAQKYGITLGIRNTKAIKTLLDRMLQMVERRKNNIWNKNFEIITNDKIDYRLTNVPELRRICKEKDIKNAHIKSKDELIMVLEETDLNPVYNENKKYYKNMTIKELKTLGKERGLTRYNNLKKDELVKLHEEFDEDLEFIVEDSNEEVNNEEENVDKETNNEYIEEVIIKNTESVNDAFLKVFTFDDKPIRTVGTYENPWFVVKDICDVLDIKKIDSSIRNIPEKWKGTQVLSTLGGLQNMSLINEAGVYKLIMRSNKPNAEKFQEFVCEDVLPSIRKTGSYSIENKYKFILENNRPLSQLLNSNNFDKEAKEIENIYDWSKNSNCPIIYIAYIGSIDNNCLIKVGFSDSKFDERLSKHISSESQYEQFRILETYEVSGKPIEDIIHSLLQTYRYPFKAQKEVYKTTSSIKEFINIVSKLLEDNDYKLKYNKLEKRYNELEKKYLELQLIKA
jgi:prophage antirepressor-like protein